MTMNDKPILKAWRREGVTLAKTMEELKTEMNGAAALVYGIRSCKLGRVKDGELDFHDRGKDTIYEARVFNEAGELRWVSDGVKSGDELLGRAVYYSEEKEVGVEGWTKTDICKSADRIERLSENSYLLWGEIDERASGSDWTILYDHQTGEIAVPLSLDADGAEGTSKKNKRLQVDFIEYAAPEPTYGNLQIVAERLTGFQTFGKKGGM